MQLTTILMHTLHLPTPGEHWPVPRQLDELGLSLAHAGEANSKIERCPSCEPYSGGHQFISTTSASGICPSLDRPSVAE